MDPKTIAELFNLLGLSGTFIIILFSMIGGAISHAIFKAIDTRFERNSKISEEVREIKRKRYEEFVEYIEKLLSRAHEEPEKEHFDNLNLIYSRMAISVPDDIVKKMTKEFDGYFDARNRNRVYLAIRKDLLGKTDLEEGDLKYWSPGKNKSSM